MGINSARQAINRRTFVFISFLHSSAHPNLCVALVYLGVNAKNRSSEMVKDTESRSVCSGHSGKWIDSHSLQ